MGLRQFYGVADGSLPYDFIAFAAGNLSGPLVVGHLFDSVGRRKMIAGTYTISGVLLAATAIAVFFAIAQSFGALGPFVYGNLIGDGKDSTRLFLGYLLGALVMVLGGAVAPPRRTTLEAAIEERIRLT